MNTETVVIRAGMADLVALAFYRVGYRPRESLVVIGLSGPRHRAGVVARIDLPPPGDRRAAVRSPLAMVRRGGHDHVVALVVSDAEPTLGPSGAIRPPHQVLARELERQARRVGLPLLDVLAVGPSSWWSYRCPETGCCPPEGHSLEAALTGPVAATLVAEGHVLASAEKDLVADVCPAADPAQLGDPQQRAAPPAPAPAPAPPVDDARERLRRWRVLLSDPSRVTAADLTWLVDALEDRWLRDAVLLTLVPGSGSVPDEVLAGADPDAMDSVLEADPDPDLLERGRVLLSAVARAAEPGHRADALALLAWSAWWSGNGARGRLLAERALADIPNHRLARLVEQLLLLGVVPAWVVRLRAAREAAGPTGLTGPTG